MILPGKRPGPDRCITASRNIPQWSDRHSRITYRQADLLPDWHRAIRDALLSVASGY